ncbi:unnamed protein product [Linum tenue]|uniref:Peptidase A1 domain-containing protein n=1 Tax=Linum tenue TaxID=586396 RepID=A0AAV0IC00_9ROSI|nr:unnamed protein product [Linum tenue]
MDTGSSFTWVKCLPCTPCSSGSGAVAPFDPSLSKTYSARGCTSQCRRCTTVRYAGKVPSHCMYTLDYLGGDHSEGIYSTEQLTFRTSDDGIATVPDVQFGCSTNLTGTNPFHKILTGIFALGDGQFPLVTRLGTSFSYCIGSLSDRYYPHNHLSFGDAVDLIGGSTPLYLEDGRYFVHLSGISLGGKMLDIKKQVFAKMALRKKIEMDSGSELFLLYIEAFEVLKAEIERLAFWELMTPVSSPLRPFELCYRGTVEKEARGFPAMGIRFVGGVELVVVRNKVSNGFDIWGLGFIRIELGIEIGDLGKKKNRIENRPRPWRDRNRELRG